MPDPAFYGDWILEPAQSRYAYGPLPRAGRYRILPDGDQLHFAITWIDWQGEAHDTGFSLPLDGGGPVRLRAIDRKTLDSEVWDGDSLKVHARRSLSPDGQHLLVSQSGHSPEGCPYSNLQRWRRARPGEPLVAAPLRVAVIGPYSAPTAAARAERLATLERAAAAVIQRGHLPLLGVTAALGLAHAAGHDDPSDGPNSPEKSALILAISEAVVANADVGLVLGRSPGADRERALLEAQGRPVLTEIQALPA